ncbi:MAG: amino acid permease [Candidatus Saccharicenans sp.]|nr:amino acid permease [Candidatus Saccharicenans sp.]
MTGNSDHQLKRALGPVSLSSIVVANMVGAGIFTTSGLLLRDLGHPLLMLALWVAGGVIALCGALSYGELGAAYPRAGGEYYFLSRLFHPLVGFLSGWVSFFVGFSAPIAASAVGFSEYLARALPALDQPINLGLNIAPVVTKKALAVLIIFLFTLIHIQGLKPGTKVQNFLTAGKVGLILFLIVVGFASGRGNWNHLTDGEWLPAGFPSLKVIGLSLMWIMFAYSGWNASAYLGSEIKNPRRDLPLSLLLGTGVVILLYLSLNLLFVYAIRPAEMKGVISVGGLAAGKLLGAGWEKFLSIMIAFALFSSLSAFIIIGPRVYYAMAADRLFFPFAAKIHPVTRVPALSIWLQGAIAAVIAVSGAFEHILTYMGFSLGIFPILAVLGVFKLRKLQPENLKLPGFPLAQIVYLAAGVSILVLGFLQSPGPSGVAILTVIAGVPAYFFFRKKYS